MSAKLSRRDFIKWGGLSMAAVGAGAFLFKRELLGTLLPALGQPLGHRLWTKNFPAPTIFREVPLVIVGGGMSALTAAWYLTKHAPGLPFEMHELEPRLGGNSTSDQNSVSPYPWGAHYVPFANAESESVREILRDLGVITGFERHIPIYNEDYICHDPEERLFFRGQWTEGLVPNVGLTEAETAEFKRFFKLTEELKNKKGRDGRPVFAIPVELSSQDREYRDLDQLSLAEYLTQRNLTCEPLRWYVDYCCKDDFGALATDCSAWAGLHYFSGRRGQAANGGNASLVTWPQGNGWIVDELKKRSHGATFTQSLVFEVVNEAEKVKVRAYDPVKNVTTEITSEAVILATPLYVTSRIFSDVAPLWQEHKKDFHHSPWLVANVTLNHRPDGAGFPLAWDNVSYYSKSIGYVVATHQRSSGPDAPTVLTFYHPYTEVDSSLKRHALLLESQSNFEDFVRAELAAMHPGILQHVTEIKTKIWGHGMIRPSTGFMWGGVRQKFSDAFGKVKLAHTDLSGISIFEEAAYQGVSAATYVKEILDR